MATLHRCMDSQKSFLHLAPIPNRVGSASPELRPASASIQTLQPSQHLGLLPYFTCSFRPSLLFVA